jgi:hypothetical protein
MSFRGAKGDNTASEITNRIKPGDKDAPTERGGPPLEDKVPRRYNDATELTFTVSSSDSSKADFDLKSP